MDWLITNLFSNVEKWICRKCNSPSGIAAEVCILLAVYAVKCKFGAWMRLIWKAAKKATETWSESVSNQMRKLTRLGKAGTKKKLLVGL